MKETHGEAALGGDGVEEGLVGRVHGRLSTILAGAGTRAVRVTDASVRRVTRAVRVTHALVRRLSSSDRVTDAPVRRLGRGGGGELYEHGADAAALAELVSPVVAPVALAPPLELAPPPTGASASMGIGLGRASIGCTF
jgi:hypothetical protein